MDDGDLDDAALWAVIDSAAASHSSSKHRKTLAIKYSNPQSPPSLVSHHSPPRKLPQKSFRNQQRLYSPSDSRSYCDDYHRPHKMSRPCASEVSESSPLAVAQRTPITTPRPLIRFPESNPYSEIVRFDSACESEVLLPLNHGRPEEGVSHSLHSLSGKFPSVELFKEYQNAAMSILEKTDYTMISGSPFIKKSGWRKIAFYFNLSFEIKDKTIEIDENRNVQRAEFVVRAHMQGGRYSDGWGSCERREKRFQKPNHDIPSTAETRAKKQSMPGPARNRGVPTWCKPSSAINPSYSTNKKEASGGSLKKKA